MSNRAVTITLAASVVGLLACGSGSSSTNGATPRPSALPPPASLPTTNRPPTIFGTPPASVRAYEGYVFLPTAADADGDTLTFRIQNRPVWATFDTASGRLAGVPSLADIGRYDGIAISVSDQIASAQIDSFSVSVNSPTGSVTLTWSPAIANVNGEPLTNLAAHVIYYGRSPLILDQLVVIKSPSPNSYIISELRRGTWYSALTSVNTEGIESDRSNTISYAVN